LLWLTAFVAALTGALTADAVPWFILSAVAFGLGFVTAGVAALRR